MNSTEFTKLAGAFLGTVFVLMTIGIVSDAIFSTHEPENPGYVIEASASTGEGESAPDESSGPEPIAPLLASADVGAGESVFKKCAACHTTEKGAGNKVGPNLWDIVGRTPGAVDGFNYSSAMSEFGAENKWDYEHLNGFLAAPKKYLKGTAMGFAGVKKTEDRADLIAYLRTLSDNPAPIE